MNDRLTFSDIFDINKKSGALILGSNRLDDYVTKFLSKYCKEALTTPMPLPVEQILSDMGLVVKEVSLSRNSDIFGCCLLLDGTVDIYDHETNQYSTTDFEAGTILIDTLSSYAYGEGSKRNTLVHEILHWEKDKTYFEILELKNKKASEKLYPIMCRQSETRYEPTQGKQTKENEVRWLEWQAHRLAPRVLMPKNSFIKKAREILKSSQDSFCNGLIKQLGDFFIVSYESVKYRLNEVGLGSEISTLPDYDDVYANINRADDYVRLTPVQAFKYLYIDDNLRKWVDAGKYIYIDGYFVLDDERFISSSSSGFQLTKKAKKNLAQCVINIREHRQSSLYHSRDGIINNFFLHKVGSVDDRVLVFHPSYQSPQISDPEKAYKTFSDTLASYNEQEEVELMKMLGDPTKSLCECLWFLMDKRNWKYPATFFEKTGLHTNYHGRIKNNTYNEVKTNGLMAICVGLGLNLRLTEKLFVKSNNKLNYYENPDKTYIRIMEKMPGLALKDFNNILAETGVPELGTIARE